MSKMNWIGLSLWVVVAFMVSSCGKPVCVMGVGDCAAFGQPTVPQSGTMSLSVDNETLNAGGTPDKATITISGGKAPYSVSIDVDGEGSTSWGYLLNSSNQQVSSLTTSASSFFVYAKADAPSTNNVNVTVRDSSSPKLSDLKSILVNKAANSLK